MPKCSVCTHPRLAEINSALAGAESQRVIASRFGLTQPSVHRHSERHVPKRLIAAAERRGLKADDSALDQVSHLVRCLETWLKAAEIVPPEELTARDAMQVFAMVARAIELKAKLLGEFAPVQVEHGVNATAVWERIKHAVFEELSRFPEAREAVAARLVRELGAEQPALLPPGETVQ